MIPKYGLFLTVLFVCLSALLVGVLFQPALTSYYFQDDWFLFSISRAQNISEFFSFFLPRGDVIWYRPLGQQLPFYLSFTFFSLNPIPFKIAVFILHIINSCLVYKLLMQFIKKQEFALFGSFLYLTSNSHQIIFYWAATVSFVQAPFFYFSCLLTQIQKRNKLSLILFILGLLSNELLITLPLILTIYSRIFKNSKNKIKPFYYWLIGGIYIVLRLIFRPAISTYGFIAGIKQPLITLRNFILWSFNWPEAIQDWFISFLRLNPLFINTFKPYVIVFSLVTLLFLLLFIILPLSYLLFIKKQRIPRGANFGFLFFLVSLSPVLVFPNHAFSYYIPIPLFGLILFSQSLSSAFTKNIQVSEKIILFFLVSFSILWLTSSFFNIKLNQRIHWAYKRAKRSEILVKQILIRYPSLSSDDTVDIISKNAEEDKLVLSDQNAVRVIFGDNKIKTNFISGKSLQNSW